MTRRTAYPEQVDTPFESDVGVARARARARAAWVRAAKASERASRYERLAKSCSPELRELIAGLAESHGRAAEMHGSSARLQAAFAHQLEAASRATRQTTSFPLFLAAVAEVLGATSTAVMLWNTDHVVAAAMASDLQARTVLDIELTLREGPGHTIFRERTPVVLREEEVAARWPDFARATAGMHLRMVAAAPLARDGASFGALTVYDPPWKSEEGHLERLQSVADALVESLSRSIGAIAEPVDGVAAPVLLDGDSTAVLHQAAGIVAQQAHCDTAAALALITARAFAEDVTAPDLASRIVAGDVHLAD
jgi:hypothetical protein